MNWQAIGVVADIVSAIAVVGSLIYLAIQLRQNTRQSRADNVQASVERWIEANVSPMRSEESADFLRRALNDYSVLSIPQRARLNAFLLELTSAFQAMYVKHRSGLLDAELYATCRTDVAGYLKCPGLAELWSEVKFSFPPDLCSELDAAIDAHQGPPFTETLPYLRPDT